MSEARRGLPSAFAAREEIESSLNGLKGLKADGSISEEQYETSMAEYRQRLEVVDGEIEDIKRGLRKQLESNQRDIRECRHALGEMQTRHEAGELPANEYKDSKRDLEEELQELEQDGRGLERLIHARSSADLGVATGESQDGGPKSWPLKEDVRTPRVTFPAAASLPTSAGDSEAGTHKPSAGEPTTSGLTGDSGADLGQALHERDEARRLLASVEQLEIGGAVTEEHRAAARADYQKRLATAEESVRAAKESVAARGRQISSELEKIRQQEAALEVRYKVGEFDQDRFEETSADLKRKAQALEKESDGLRRLYEADTAASADAAAAAMQIGVAPPQKVPGTTAGERPSRKATARPAGAGAPGGIAGWLKQSSRARLVGLGLIIVGAIVVVALLAQAGMNAAGGFTLPGLPNPFAGGGADAPAGTAPGDDFDEQTPSQNGTSTLPPGTPGTFAVSLNLQEASGVGSLHVEMVFDTNVLELVDVQQGSLHGDALMKYGVKPGRVTIGMVSPSGLSGNLPVAVVTLRTTESAPASGQSPLLLENVVAHNSETFAELGGSMVSGSVDWGSGTVVAPIVVFGA